MTVGAELCGKRADRVGAAGGAIVAPAPELVGDCPHVRRPAIAQHLDRARQIFEIARVARPVGDAEDIESVPVGERRHLDHFEPGRVIAQEPHRPGCISARQHEPVFARGQPVDQFVHHAAEPRKALERAELQELVEQEGDRLAAAGSRTHEKCERCFEGGAGADWCGIGNRERRRANDRAMESLGRRRRAFDVDELGGWTADPLSHLVEQRGSAAAAPGDEHRDAGRRSVERRDDAACQAGSWGHHARPSRIGKRRPERSAAASASG